MVCAYVDGLRSIEIDLVELVKIKSKKRLALEIYANETFQLLNFQHYYCHHDVVLNSDDSCLRNNIVTVNGEFWKPEWRKTEVFLVNIFERHIWTSFCFRLQLNKDCFDWGNTCSNYDNCNLWSSWAKSFFEILEQSWLDLCQWEWIFFWLERQERFVYFF